MHFITLENFVGDHRPSFEEAGPPASLWQRICADLDQTDPDLESFIKRNRESFDDEELPASIWGGIEAKLAANTTTMQVVSSPSKAKVSSAKVRRFPAWYAISAAAAVALLITAAFLLGRSTGYESGQDDYMALIEQVQPDFADTEAHFQNEIAERFELVMQHNEDPQLQADLEDIDRAMGEIKAELATVPQDERAELVSRLIESYRLKLQILERILKHLPVSEASPETLNYHETNNI
ncbi:MAG: hypothetical protein AAGF87_06710 [Bacteroidota bacterium]